MVIYKAKDYQDMSRKAANIILAQIMQYFFVKYFYIAYFIIYLQII